MTNFKQMRFRAVGPLAGHDIRVTHKYNTFQAIGGKCVVNVPIEEEQSYIESFAIYGMYEEGSEAMRNAEARYGVSSDNEASAPKTQRSPSGVQGNSDGKRNRKTSQERSDVGGADADSGQADAGPANADNSQGDGTRRSLETGWVLIPREESPNPKLYDAILELDPVLDKHWTSTGKPAMSAVERIYGSTAITRRDVKAAAPDWDREQALARKLEEQE